MSDSESAPGVPETTDQKMTRLSDALSELEAEIKSLKESTKERLLDPYKEGAAAYTQLTALRTELQTLANLPDVDQKTVAELLDRATGMEGAFDRYEGVF